MFFLLLCLLASNGGGAAAQAGTESAIAALHKEADAIMARVSKIHGYSASMCVDAEPQFCPQHAHDFEGHTAGGAAGFERTSCIMNFPSYFPDAESVQAIAEVGFNCGHGASTLLSMYPNAKLYEFDMCAHDYSSDAKAFIDKHFPGRVTITCGDSTKTIPKFAQEHPDLRFDLVHVDGGHEGVVPFADIGNMARFAWRDSDSAEIKAGRRWHNHTVVIVDDCNDGVGDLTTNDFASTCMTNYCFTTPFAPGHDEPFSGRIVSRSWASFKHFAAVEKLVAAPAAGATSAAAMRVPEHCDFGNCVGRYNPAFTAADAAASASTSTSTLSMQVEEEEAHSFAASLAACCRDDAQPPFPGISAASVPTGIRGLWQELKHGLDISSVSSSSTSSTTTDSELGPKQLWQLLQELKQADEAIGVRYRFMAQTGLRKAHASAALLLAFPDAQLFVFDRCADAHSANAIAWLKHRFRGRVSVRCGDSSYEIPDWQKEFPKLKLDLIFIDGGGSDNTPFDELTSLRASAWREGHMGEESTEEGSVRTGMGGGKKQKQKQQQRRQQQQHYSPSPDGAEKVNARTMVLMGNGCRDTSDTDMDKDTATNTDVANAASHAWSLSKLTGSIEPMSAALAATLAASVPTGQTSAAVLCVGEFRTLRRDAKAAEEYRTETLREVMGRYETAAAATAAGAGAGAGLYEEGAAMYAMAVALSAFGEYDQATQWFIDTMKLSSEEEEVAVKKMAGAGAGADAGDSATVQVQVYRAQLLRLYSLVSLAIVRFNSALARTGTGAEAHNAGERERAVLVTQAEQVLANACEMATKMESVDTVQARCHYYLGLMQEATGRRREAVQSWLRDIDVIAH
jgi:hypothetical protein